MRLILGAVVVVAVASCSTPEAAPDPPVSTRPPSDPPTTSTTDRPAPSPCDDFAPRYLGQGLSADLPMGSVASSGESTADIGPIHAGWDLRFDLPAGTITIGRRVGRRIVAEAYVAQHVDGDVVVFVKSESEPLRTCVLESARYDRELDARDGWRDGVCEAEPMRYRRLGRTALQVSELCLGTMNFGPQTPEDESFAIMDRALELGINFFDTANRYGGDKGVGATESIVGRWFAQGGGRREKVVLATKLFGAMSEWPNDGRLSARHIRMACDDSLRRMQTDHIDLYQMHHVDRTAPWEEVWQAMDMLIQQGKITYVGSSNFAGWHIVRANEAATRLHTLGLVSEQSHYNLLVRTVELEVLPACREYGVGMIPWSPLSSGLLGGVLGDSDRARRQSPQSLRRIDKLRPKLEQWEKLCADLGEEPAAVALAWLLAQDGVTCPIIGPRTMAQLDGASLRALDIGLAPDTLTAIDAIFPGPGGTAPEAYAW